MKGYRTWLSGFLLAVVWSVALSFPIEPGPVAATHAETCIHGWLASESGQLRGPLRLERLLAAQGALGAHPDLLQNMLGPRGCCSKAREQGFAKAHHNLGVVYASAMGLGRNQDAAVNQPVVVRQELSSEQYEATSIGTAWPISSGYVVTNNHVVSQSNDVLVITASGQQIRAWAAIRDEASDIALLEVSDSHKLPPALPLATSQAKLGASVFTIGFPRVDFMDSTPKLSDGVISDVNGLHGDPGSYQTTVPIQPGNSGGPLLNMRGEVVGVVRSMLGISDETHEKIFVLQNASCARKIEFVKELSALLPRHDSVIRALPSHPDSLETLAERVQGSVLIVIAR